MKRRKVRIYRVELECGAGPYTGPVPEGHWQTRCHSGNPETPGVGFDVQGFSYLRHVCGFASLASLYQWFEPLELVTLQALGFRVNVYQVNAQGVVYGTRQVGFCKDGAKLVSMLEPVEVLHRARAA